MISALTGQIDSYAGDIYMEDIPCRQLKSRIIQKKVQCIKSDSNVIPALSVVDYFYALRATPGKLLYNAETAAKTMRDTLDKLQLHGITPFSGMAELTRVQFHILAFAKAVETGAQVIILDDITEYYTAEDYGRLYSALTLYPCVGCVYISNREDPLIEMADRVIVMRDGRIADTLYRGQYNSVQLRLLLKGASNRDQPTRKSHKKPQTAARIEHLSISGRPVSFDVNKGEIVGIFDLARHSGNSLFNHIVNGGYHSFTLEGKTPKSLPDAVSSGLAFLSSHYLQDGLFRALNWKENLTIQVLKKASRFSVLNRRMLDFAVTKFQDNIKAGEQYESKIDYLQLAFYKVAAAQPRLIVLESPRAGLDFISCQQFYSTLEQIAETGIGILVLSYDMRESNDICDKFLVNEYGRQYWVNVQR